MIPLTADQESYLKGVHDFFTAMMKLAEKKEQDRNGPNPPDVLRDLSAETLKMSEVLRIKNDLLDAAGLRS